MKGSTVKAMVAARDRAAQTPDEVRAAFLAKRVVVAGIEFQPFTLGILWLLEELESPFMDPAKRGQPMTLADTARAIFVYAHPMEARAALTESRAELDAQATTLALTILPGELPAINAALTRVTQEGLATVPGAGDGNPRETAPG